MGLWEQLYEDISKQYWEKQNMRVQQKMKTLKHLIYLWVCGDKVYGLLAQQIGPQESVHCMEHIISMTHCWLRCMTPSQQPSSSLLFCKHGLKDYLLMATLITSLVSTSQSGDSVFPLYPSDSSQLHKLMKEEHLATRPFIVFVTVSQLNLDHSVRVHLMDQSLMYAWMQLGYVFKKEVVFYFWKICCALSQVKTNVSQCFSTSSSSDSILKIIYSTLSDKQQFKWSHFAKGFNCGSYPEITMCASGSNSLKASNANITRQWILNPMRQLHNDSNIYV